MLKTIERGHPPAHRGREGADGRRPARPPARAHPRGAAREPAARTTWSASASSSRRWPTSFDVMEIALAAVKLAHEATGTGTGERRRARDPRRRPPAAAPARAGARSRRQGRKGAPRGPAMSPPVRRRGPDRGRPAEGPRRRDHGRVTARRRRHRRDRDRRPVLARRGPRDRGRRRSSRHCAARRSRASARPSGATAAAAEAARQGVGTGVAVPAAVGVGVGDTSGVGVGVAVAVGVALCVGVALGVGVADGVGVGVEPAPAFGVGVGVGAAFGYVMPLSSSALLMASLTALTCASTSAGGSEVSIASSFFSSSVSCRIRSSDGAEVTEIDELLGDRGRDALRAVEVERLGDVDRRDPVALADDRARAGRTRRASCTPCSSPARRRRSRCRRARRRTR